MICTKFECLCYSMDLMKVCCSDTCNIVPVFCGLQVEMTRQANNNGMLYKGALIYQGVHI